MFHTPILFIIFNRPDTTQIVFDRIKQIKPKKLFIAADGPREEIEGEKDKCNESRNIIKQIDWECDIKTLYRNENLGCGLSVSTAITWFFDHVEEGIILEDDCLPDLSFFNFCSVLLEKYRNNNNIMHISGNNFQFGRKRGNATYYFSHYPHNWGWATWKRAWEKFDFDLNLLDDYINSISLQKTRNKKELDFFMNILKSQKLKLDIWDYQWLFATWYYNGLSIIPNNNLVTNIGFGNNATHTNNKDDISANIPTKPIKKITHPLIIK